MKVALSRYIWMYEYIDTYGIGLEVKVRLFTERKVGQSQWLHGLPCVNDANPPLGSITAIALPVLTSRLQHQPPMPGAESCHIGVTIHHSPCPDRT
jgi:hypothetical protein